MDKNFKFCLIILIILVGCVITLNSSSAEDISVDSINIDDSKEIQVTSASADFNLNQQNDLSVSVNENEEKDFIPKYGAGKAHYLENQTKLSEVQEYLKDSANDVQPGDVIYLFNKTFENDLWNSGGLNITINGLTFVGGTSDNPDGYSIISDNPANDWGAIDGINLKNDNIILKNLIFDCANKNTQSSHSAVAISGSDCSIINSVFSNSKGKKYIADEEDVENTLIEGCEFKDITKNYGEISAIHLVGSNSQIKNCNFTNLQSNNGSAINYGGSDLSIENCNFTEINSPNQVVKSDGNVNLKNSIFKDNTVQNGGYLFDCKGTAVIEGCNFTQNNASNGDIHVEGNDAILNYTNIINTGNVLFEGNATVVNCNFSNINSKSEGSLRIKGEGSEVKDSKFESNNASNGGAIYADNKITIDNCSFINNTASGNGGAIVVKGDDSKIINSKFEMNKAGTGGAIDLSGDRIVIDNCKFDNNNVSNSAGAINIHDAEDTTVVNSNFFSNYAKRIGGAIDLNSVQSTNFDNCNFFSNYAEEVRAGAISLTGDAYETKINDCHFFNNTAAADGGNPIDYGGGAIWSANSVIFISNSLFDNNTGSYGGAVRGGARINNCTFYNNTAFEGNGGAYDATVDDTLHDNSEVINSTFIDNKALSSDPVGNDRSQGGAIHSYHLDTLLVDNCTFLTNQAYRGGAIDIFTSPNRNTIGTIINCNLDSNNATIGGGITLFSNEALIENVSLTKNNATYGGAVYINGSDSKIINTNSSDNLAVFGGSTYSIGDNTYIDNCKLLNNEARPVSDTPEHDTKMNDGLGGGCYLTGNNATIINSVFEGNKARNGSAIYSDEDLFIMNKTILNNNQAWSYLIPINADPQRMPYGDKSNVTILLYGGDNIANAIYNKKDVGEVYLHEVTYEYNDHSVITNRTTTDSEVHPIDGIENAIDEDGNLKGIYQDTRENNQNIIVNVCKKYENGTYSDPVRTYNLTTDVYGKVSQIVDETPLPIGNYTIFAEHPEDSLYKFIKNLTDIEVYGSSEICDIAVTKVANASVVSILDNVTWTITVTNNGPSVAENVIVKDVIDSNIFNIVKATLDDGTELDVSGPWSIGDLANGDSVVITVVSTALDVGNGFNNVSVNTTTTESNYTNNNDSANVTVGSVCDLVIGKSANMTVVVNGSGVSWTVTVVNNGNVVAENVVVRDVLPKGLSYVDSRASVGDYDVASGVWAIGSLNAGDKATLVIDTLAVASGNVTNVANVTTTTPENDTTNNQDNDTVEVTPICDIVVIKVANVSSVVVGDKVTWIITVKNNGPSVAENVFVNDVLPKGLKFENAFAIIGEYDADIGLWAIGSLDAGDKATLVIDTLAVASGNVTNVANVTTTTPENDTTNNQDNDTVEVTPICDIVVIKVANVTKVSKGDLVTWTITVKNNGPSDAKNVFVKDILPKGFVVAGTGAHSYTWNLGTLKAGQKVVLTLKTKALEVGNWTNIVIINTTTPENDTDNNVDNATVTVVNKETPIHNNSTKHVKHKHNNPVYEKGIAMKHTGNALNLAAIALLVLLCALFIRVNYRKE